MENPFKKTANGSSEDKKIQAEIEENLDEKLKEDVASAEEENFYFQIKDQIDALFNKYSKFDALSKIISNSNSFLQIKD